MLQNTSEIFSLGILSLVGQARLAGGDRDNLSTSAPHEGRLARRKPMFCQRLLGRAHTRHEKLWAILGGAYATPAMSGCPRHLCSARLSVVMLQCWGTHSTSAMPGYPVGDNRRARRCQQESPGAGSFP